MNSAVSPRLATIRHALGERDLVWFGTRGIDALPLIPLGRLALVVGQIAPLPEQELPEGVAQDNLELRSRIRRDLDRYDIDSDYEPDAASLKQEFLARMDAPVVMAAYRAHEFLGRPSFCLPKLTAAMNFHLVQRQFEHKPWVERQMAELGDIPVLASTFVRDSDFACIARLLEKGPLVGRCATGSGGIGVFTFATEEEYAERLPAHRDGFVGVAPLLEASVPLNINACVYRNGDVATFGTSYQLIGVPGLTRRKFGFAGNDFAAARNLPPEAMVEIERITRRIGRWLRGFGYLGVFGLDVLYHGGRIHVIELNARFQASTPLSARINQRAEMPDPFTEHIAAFLGMEPPVMPSLADQANSTRGAGGPVAQVIHRNISTSRLRSLGRDESVNPPGVLIQAVPDKGVHVEREAMLFKSLHDHQITEDGYSVHESVDAARSAVAIAVA